MIKLAFAVTNFSYYFSDLESHGSTMLRNDPQPITPATRVGTAAGVNPAMAGQLSQMMRSANDATNANHDATGPDATNARRYKVACSSRVALAVLVLGWLETHLHNQGAGGNQGQGQQLHPGGGRANDEASTEDENDCRSHSQVFAGMTNQ
jgi:hypothetical protein